MSQVSAAPGWYADPTDSGRWRWFDGAAWTEHVSAPAGPPAAPLYNATTVVAGAGAHDWQSAPKRPPTTLTRVLVIVAATFAGLWGLSAVLGILTAGFRAAHHPPRASGPAIVLSESAPVLVDGLPRSTDSNVQRSGDQLLAGLQATRRGMPGGQQPQGEVYAVQGTGAAVLGWVRDDEPLDQAALARGVQDGMAAEHMTRHVVSAEPDGATLLCAAAATSNRVPYSLCTWVRSGSGVVTLLRVGSADTDALAAVTRDVVGQLSART